MSPSQVQAASNLLRKILPDLASQEITDRREGWLDVLKRLASEEKRAKPVSAAPHCGATSINNVENGSQEPVKH